MRKGVFYWTKRNCAIEALKYTSRKEFRKNARSAYNIILKNKWDIEMFSHFNYMRKYYTKEICIIEANKYKTRSEFQYKSNGAYRAAKRNKWLNEICQHMLLIGNLKRRCIYVAEFSDNSFYVGLTYSYNKRIQEHMSKLNTSVNKHIRKSGLIPIFTQLTDYIEVNDAKYYENFYYNVYKNKGGLPLNITKPGSIGGTILYWNKENCHKEALKYETRSKYAKYSRSSYNAARKNNWFNDITTHMFIKHNY